jgi:hypothetical protein
LLGKWKKLSALPLLSLLQACSIAGAKTEEPPRVTGTAEQICKGWPLITPSRKADKLSEPTAKQINDANIANEAWCKREPVPPKTS